MGNLGLLALIGEVFCESPLAHNSTFAAVLSGFTLFATGIATVLGKIGAENKGKFPYKLCVLKDRGGDIEKRWFLEFYVWHEAQNKMVRKVDYISSAKFPTAKQRVAEAKRIKLEIDKALVSGKIIRADKPKLKKESASGLNADSKLSTAIEYVEKLKKAHHSVRTFQAYQTFKNRIFEFQKDNHIEDIPVQDFDVNIASLFFDWLKIKKKITNTTYNNYLTLGRAIFNFFLARKIIKSNPLNSLAMLKSVVSSHPVYLSGEREEIKNHLLVHDPQMLLFCSFIYFTFVRPHELHFLQVKHIQGDKLLIPAEIKINGEVLRVSKNGKSQFVVIPSPLKKMIEEYNILSFPEDHFIFSKKKHPDTEYVHKNYFNINYRKYLNVIEIANEKTLYAWKHTGVCELYNKIKDIKKIQQQCRHHDIKMTDNYMRDLGLFDNKDVENMFPEF